MSQLIVQIYKLSRNALKTKARVVKVNHDLLHIVLQVNQSKISGIHAKRRYDILVLFVAQCTLVKSGAVHSGWMQCILVKSDEFENSYSLLYIFLNTDYVTARSLAPQQLFYGPEKLEVNQYKPMALRFTRQQQNQVINRTT